MSDLSDFEVNAVMGDASASTHYFNQNGKEVVLIGPVGNTDQIGERPMKQFIKSERFLFQYGIDLFLERVTQLT